MRIAFWLILVLSLLFATAYAASVTVSWDAPVTREDGSALAITDLSGYQIGYGTVSRGTNTVFSYPNMVNVANPVTLRVTHTLTSDLTGTIFFSVRAVDNYQQTSAWGQEVSKVFLPAPPSVPRNISFVTGLMLYSATTLEVF